MKRAKGLVLVVVTASFLLNGCVAAHLIGGTVGGELVSDRLLSEEKFKGSDLLRLADWNNPIDKSTTTLSGREAWVCADMNRDVRKQMDINNSYQTACLAEENKPVQKETYACKDGKGGALAAVFNKDTFYTYFCENIKTKK